jgi:hypothetical protein
MEEASPFDRMGLVAVSRVRFGGLERLRLCGARFGVF